MAIWSHQATLPPTMAETSKAPDVLSTVSHASHAFPLSFRVLDQGRARTTTDDVGRRRTTTDIRSHFGSSCGHGSRSGPPLAPLVGSRRCGQRRWRSSSRAPCAAPLAARGSPWLLRRRPPSVSRPRSFLASTRPTRWTWGPRSGSATSRPSS